MTTLYNTGAKLLKKLLKKGLTAYISTIMTKADDIISAGLCISQVQSWTKDLGLRIADHYQLGIPKGGGVVVTNRNTQPYSGTLYSQFRGSSIAAYCD